jgi:3-deoxy-7-phosphoheptulonate synthase
MLLILHANTDESSEEYRKTCEFLRALPRIEMRTHVVQGQQQTLTEVYLIGDTAALILDEMEALPAVERAVRVSEEYRVLGRHRTTESHPPISNTTACASARTTSMSSRACAP